MPVWPDARSTDRNEAELMRGLVGKVIVVAAGGTTPGKAALGSATAQRLAEEGAKVLVGDLRMELAETTVAAINRAGGEATAWEFDAADEPSVQALLDAAVTTYGGLDGVHSNAMDMSAEAIGEDGLHTITTLPLSVWQRSLDVGLTGFFLVARAAIPHLVERGGGSIVGTASGAVFAGEPIRLAYATAKTGMGAIIRHVASAYGQKGIRANLVAPGFVPGQESLDNMTDDHRKAMTRISRSGRMGFPDDIASAVTFLLSDDASWINGQILSVDGGTVFGR